MSDALYQLSYTPIEGSVGGIPPTKDHALVAHNRVVSVPPAGLPDPVERIRLDDYLEATGVDDPVERRARRRVGLAIELDFPDLQGSFALEDREVRRIDFGDGLCGPPPVREVRDRNDFEPTIAEIRQTDTRATQQKQSTEKNSFHVRNGVEFFGTKNGTTLVTPLLLLYHK
ncbi:MAG: hypothetical protein RL150_55 [Candidatus Parcubacteria bacterium]